MYMYCEVMWNIMYWFIAMRTYSSRINKIGSIELYPVGQCVVSKENTKLYVLFLKIKNIMRKFAPPAILNSVQSNTLKENNHDFQVRCVHDIIFQFESIKFLLSSKLDHK